MLRVDHLHAFYGKSHVLHGVQFEVRAGEIVALLGRNGSGRSTTAKAIMGMVECTGDVVWNGRNIRGCKPYEIAHLGIGYVPENRDIFPKLTVHQNLMLGQKSARQKGRWSFGALLRVVGRQDRVAIDQGNVVGRDLGPSAGFATFALNGGVRINDRVQLTAGIDNLFDRAYSEHLNLAGSADFGYPADPVRINEPRRSAWLKLNIRY